MMQSVKRINFNSHVSFVMPAYNSSSTIKESLNSIVRTNLMSGDEIIIVNDGSTDGTFEVVKTYAKMYKFVRVIDNKINKGCPASRNIGIKSAKNPLIFNLDADDILAEHSVELLKNYLVENKADLAAFGEIHFFRDNSKKIFRKWICQSGQLTLEDFLAGPITPGGNFLYTKKSWEKIGGYWEFGRGLHEYWGFCLKQIASGSKFYVLSNSYYLHRLGKESLFKREFKDSINSSLVATKMISHYLHLLDKKDTQMILSENGRSTWFSNYRFHPLKTKHGNLGRTGYVEQVESFGKLETFRNLTIRPLSLVIKILSNFKNKNKINISRKARLFKLDLIKIGRGSQIKDFVIIETKRSVVEIGENCQINPFTVIYGGSGIFIRNDVMIGPHCMLAAGNHNYKRLDKPMREAGSITKGPIRIEDDVWIGANCTITDGAHIGEGAVIGANSVVVSDIPAYSIYGGVPARKIGTRK